ncbi:MAG: ketoacyl-ACP synthase III [Bacteroidales bacterium]|nr:ketoacyl-ACP synthase III [Bacteroidales bacterium]
MKIIGTGSAVPSKVVTNDMLASFLDTNDEWISARTGIKTRHIVSDETLLDLATTASQQALQSAGVAPEELDMIICSNVANNYVTPALSTIVQGNIGSSCPCLDLNAACAGFIYALDIAESFLKTARAKKILILCAEEPTKFCNWHERNTSVLFGDGAGAVVVTDGDNLKSIRLTASAKKEVLYYQRKMEPTPFEHNIEETKPLVMVGRDVFRMAVSSSCHDADAVLSEAGLQPNDIDLYLLHQANLRIIEAIRNHLEQPEEKFPSNIQRYGNTSSASIPILMDELSRSGRLPDGGKLLLSAFGAGFVTGACVMEWQTIHY